MPPHFSTRWSVKDVSSSFFVVYEEERSLARFVSFLSAVSDISFYASANDPVSKFSDFCRVIFWHLSVRNCRGLYSHSWGNKWRLDIKRNRVLLVVMSSFPEFSLVVFPVIFLFRRSASIEVVICFITNVLFFFLMNSLPDYLSVFLTWLMIYSWVFYH